MNFNDSKFMEISSVHRIMVAGIGQGVGKTIVSAILANLFGGDYWKPVQFRDKEASDRANMKKWIETGNHSNYPPIHLLKTPLYFQHVTHLENTLIRLNTVVPQKTNRSLIIESINGMCLPLTMKILSFDLFKSWNCEWVIVSKHYSGSISHTLLIIEALKQRQIPIRGVIFNGRPRPDKETAILGISQVPFLGRLLPESHINQQVFEEYAKQWKPCFSDLLLN